MWCSLSYAPWGFRILHIQGMQCGDPQHLVSKKSGKLCKLEKTWQSQNSALHISSPSPPIYVTKRFLLTLLLYPTQCQNLNESLLEKGLFDGKGKVAALLTVSKQ